MCTDDDKSKLHAILFDDDTVLTAENERDLQKLVREFNIFCQKRELRVNVKKVRLWFLIWKSMM